MPFLIFADMIRIDSKLYIVGHAHFERNPFMVITDLDGNLIYESACRQKGSKTAVAHQTA